MASPWNEDNLTISDQPRASGFVPYQINTSGPPILAPLAPLTFLALKHDREAECCSSTSRYELVGLNKEILLKGYMEARRGCCNPRLEPIFIHDLQGTPLITVQIDSTQRCCSGTNEVEICAPPGNPIGSIVIDFQMFQNTCEIASNLTGQRLFVKTKRHLLGPPEFLIQNQSGVEVAVIKARQKFKLEILSPAVDLTMKANLIGFMIVLDIFAQVERQRQQQQRQR